MIANSALLSPPCVRSRPSVAMGQLPTLLVLSHLRWGFVYQRPQHLVSSLAGRWRVLFVEEPMPTEGPARLVRHTQGPKLEVWAPQISGAAAGHHGDDLWKLLRPLLAAELAAEHIEVDAVLVYTPMAVPLLSLFGANTPVFYDCMDELSAFAGAPAQLQRYESELLTRAAAVWTGGPSLYEEKRQRHPQVHCLPGAVDTAHFEPCRLNPASASARAAAALQGSLSGPRLGYFGVIDDRIDTHLLETLADRHPEWQIVMAGPVINLDPATLPLRANLHWLGMQPYGRLPYLLAGWDVALMPFALNEAARFINPTTALEFMAGDKPVVSTAVSDVASLYAHAVEVAKDTEAFITACEGVLAEGRAARCRRSLVMMATVAMVSWERNAHYIHTMLHAALKERSGLLAAVERLPPPAVQLPRVPANAALRV